MRVEAGEKTKEFETSAIAGENDLWIPAEYSSGNFFASVDLADNTPDGSVVYAVYPNPQDGSICRVKLLDGNDTFLKNTTVFQCSNVTSSIKFEIRKNGALLQSVNVPIYYRAHLTDIELKDFWGHEVSTGLKDTIDDQSLEIKVTQNILTWMQALIMAV